MSSTGASSARAAAARPSGSQLEQAQKAADAGRHEEARELCRSALLQDALSAPAHHLLASIALERGEHEVAKSHFKKVIYLAPGLAWPYIEMDALYRREGDHARARTMRRAALQVLEALPPESPVPPHPSNPRSPQPASPGATGAATAGQIIEHLKATG